MRTVCWTLVAVTLAFGMAGTVEAMDLTTAPMFVIAPNTTHCMVVNVSRVTRNVTLTVVNTTVPTTTTSGPISVAPGGVGDLQVNPSVNSLMYCKITVDGSKTGVRGSFCVLQGVTSCSGTVLAE